MDGSKAFYGEVFGWQGDSVELGEFEATMLRVPGYADVLELSDPGLRRRHVQARAPEGFSDAIGWMMRMTSDRFDEDAAPHWSVTFAVDDTHAIAARAAELGGRIVVPPFDSPPVSIAVLSDPQGAVFSVNTYDPGTTS